MQNMFMQPAMQPFINLVQSNMALLARYSMSPEAMTQAMANAQKMAKGEQPTTGVDLVQSTAFAELMQGMIQNYTVFMTELGQSGMAMLAQGQAAMMKNVQDAGEGSTGTAEARARRGR